MKTKYMNTAETFYLNWKSSAALAFMLAMMFLVYPENSAAENDSQIFNLIVSGQTGVREGLSRAQAKTLALFEAKKKAVETAEKYLTVKHRLWMPEEKKREILNSTAARVSFEIMDESWTGRENLERYSAKISVTVKLSDFIEAEMQNLHYESKDIGKSLLELMEPTFDNSLEPGRDLAEAYRLIRLEKQRPAIIYLDRLKKKYPGWHEILFAKAFAYYTLDEISKMKDALRKACRMGSEKACEDFEMLRNTG